MTSIVDRIPPQAPETPDMVPEVGGVVVGGSCVRLDDGEELAICSTSPTVGVLLSGGAIVGATVSVVQPPLSLV